MIEFAHVFKRYPGGFDALRDINLRIEAGEMAFITGHSGAGKSTLLRLITAIDRPTRGEAAVNGKNLTKLPRRRIPYFRREIGVIFQDHKLLFDRTVYDNVALPLIVTGTDQQEIPRRVRAALEMVGLLDKERMLPEHSPAANSSASASHAPWSTNHPCCWRTSQPVISMASSPTRSSTCFLIFITTA